MTTRILTLLLSLCAFTTWRASSTEPTTINDCALHDHLLHPNLPCIDDEQLTFRHQA